MMKRFEKDTLLERELLQEIGRLYVKNSLEVIKEAERVYMHYVSAKYDAINFISKLKQNYTIERCV